LHTHTNLSTGHYPPETLVRILADQNIRVFAVADHGEQAGFIRAKRASQEIGSGALILPAVELDANAAHAGKNYNLHLLVYFPSEASSQEITKAIAKASETRRNRIIMTLGKLSELGFDVGGVGRVDGVATREIEVVNALWKKPENRALANSLLTRAFNPTERPRDFLGFVRGLSEPGERVTRYSVPAEYYINAVNALGGHVVLAHPGLQKLYVPTPVIERLVDVGLHGIEVFHPNHSSVEVRRLAEIARQRGMTATFGSDFHKQWPTQFKRLLDRKGQLEVIEEIRRVAGDASAPRESREFARKLLDHLKVIMN